MMDYVNLIQFYKQLNPAFKNSPVIVAGGSYGGMLAAWIRMKYPQHFTGALASSAPILWFRGKIDPSAYNAVAGQVIKRKEFGGQQCYNIYSRGIFDLTNLAQDPSHFDKVQEIFHVCEKLNKTDDVLNIIDQVSDSLGTLNMVNYPYPTGFIGTLPAWPVKYACDAAINSTKAEKLGADISKYNYTHVEALYAAYNVTFNYTGTAGKCWSISSEEQGSLDSSGWEIQTCNDLPLP